MPVSEVCHLRSRCFERRAIQALGLSCHQLLPAQRGSRGLEKKEENDFSLVLAIEELRYLRARAGDAFASIDPIAFPTRIAIPIERASSINEELVLLIGRDGISL